MTCKCCTRDSLCRLSTFSPARILQDLTLSSSCVLSAIAEGLVTFKRLKAYNRSLCISMRTNLGAQSACSSAMRAMSMAEPSCNPTLRALTSVPVTAVFEVKAVALERTDFTSSSSSETLRAAVADKTAEFQRCFACLELLRKESEREVSLEDAAALSSWILCCSLFCLAGGGPIVPNEREDLFSAVLPPTAPASPPAIESAGCDTIPRAFIATKHCFSKSAFEGAKTLPRRETGNSWLIA